MNLGLPRNTTLYSLGRTNTFRAAAGALFTWKPYFDGYGTNLQNIEISARAMYIPDEGYEFGSVDQSGAEAKIVAYLADDGKYRDLFANNIKPHTYVALHMFKEKWKQRNATFDIDGLCHLLPKELPKHDQWKAVDKFIKSSDDWPASERYYYLAKQTAHSSNYGIRATTFRMNVLEKSNGQVALSHKDGEFFLEFYRGMFPEIPRWNYEVYCTVSKHRTLYNLLGHPRYFGGEQNDEFFRNAYAFVPQSTVGEITHIAFRNLQQYIEDNRLDWHLLANTHDSYLMEYKPAEREHAKQKMLEFMQQDLTSPSGIKFQMGAEFKYGMDWSFPK